MKGYMSAREASYKWGVSESRVHKLCQQGRIPGLERFGRSWVIPEDAEKPTDPRHDRQNARIKTAEQESCKQKSIGREQNSQKIHDAEL